jgi:hypothetical protein
MKRTKFYNNITFYYYLTEVYNYIIEVHVELSFKDSHSTVYLY